MNVAVALVGAGGKNVMVAAVSGTASRKAQTNRAARMPAIRF